MKIDDYCILFSRLKRAPNKIFPATTKKKAPHKPLLLLAVMDLIERRQLSACFISVEGELTELNALFTSYWRRLMPIAQKSSIAFPFSRLNTEPFWKLVPRAGMVITQAEVQNVSTVIQLRRLANGARIDEDLFNFMSQANGRRQLTGALLHACFSDEGQRVLLDEMGVQEKSYQYSRLLKKRAHTVNDGDSQESYSDEVRDQGFRRAVVYSYDHRCALCGVRIVTSEGHTAVEAAHIKPWSRFKDDDLRNGIALCRLCHWAFDEGLMSVDGGYNVLISRQMFNAPNAASFLMTLAGRAIICPTDTAVWPDPKRLAWHHSHIGVGL
jgi:putative restriction endonuclease